jgi:hypothetical protein
VSNFQLPTLETDLGSGEHSGSETLRETIGENCCCQNFGLVAGREQNEITLRIRVEQTPCLKLNDMFTNKMTSKVKLNTIVKRVFVLPLLGSSERENQDV